VPLPAFAGRDEEARREDKIVLRGAIRFDRASGGVMPSPELCGLGLDEAVRFLTVL
jgi:hypothetical protein